ncbi:MAG: hypothetical protein C0606_09320 [Hyphomicrobiales bacterium]|nr:MAG: hypothetical protein C0606_09320 [Hyphomicrobiales bacterium]
MLLRALLIAVAGWLCFLQPVQAETLVLIQGYLGSAGSWRHSGVAPVLVASGWADGGHLTLGPRGVAALTAAPDAAQRFYTLDLPTEAPVGVQARLLNAYVDWVAARHKDDPIVLVGHSAGGVVARFVMVTRRDRAVRGLITIASPHLGSGLADTASAIGNSPLAMVAPLFGGGTLNRSRGLYQDLGTAGPQNLVGWLNMQTHPDAHYVSVIRTENPHHPGAGDDVAEGWRQDLRNVPALKGRAKSYASPGGYELRADDGYVIANVVEGFGLAGESTKAK